MGTNSVRNEASRVLSHAHNLLCLPNVKRDENPRVSNALRVDEIIGKKIRCRWQTERKNIETEKSVYSWLERPLKRQELLVRISDVYMTVSWLHFELEHKSVWDNTLQENTAVFHMKPSFRNVLIDVTQSRMSLPFPFELNETVSGLTTIRGENISVIKPNSRRSETASETKSFLA